jgi:predicted type IV restriction endonuclease
MDFKDELKLIAERIEKLKDQINTEEATKNAFIMPFIKALGYDVFNPIEVVPEYVTDIGTKKGEKIDYAIFKDGNPCILVECKHWNQNLDIHDGQLLRYYHVSRAKFGLLTNGIEYRFYSDLELPNIMDKKPFLEFNITDLKDNQIEELKKFHKSYFNIESILNSASDLKYLNELKHLLNEELNNPTNDFINHFAKQIYSGRITSKVIEQFSGLTKKAIAQYTSELFTDKLKTALKKEDESNNIAQNTISNEPSNDEGKLITTNEEIEAFMIVKSILRQKVDSNRIVYRDAQSYFSVLLDDNNRKTICRLYFNGNKKSIAFLDENKKESKVEISILDNIFDFSSQLIERVEQLDKLASSNN